MFFFVCIGGLFVTSSARQIDEVRDGVCREYNTFYKIKNSCDAYVECNAHKATYKTCPDGLYFISDVEWPQYSCAYPSDVQCDYEDASLMYTPVCKHQYGFFASPLASRSNCGKYRMCVEGKAFEMECATGLAFDPDTGRCDYPDLVPPCDAEAFLRFKCPPATYDENGKAYVVNFGIKGSCHYYFSCMDGVARLELCDTGYDFDKTLNRCVDAIRVQCTKK